MAVYKVPQDVEADDKLIGPFSFRQFIYLIVVALSGTAAWGLGQLFLPLAILPVPLILFFGAIALPLRKDQPMEVYMAAMVSFYLKPRRRLWEADGIESLIEITVPKTIEIQRTKNITQNEAQERFGYLAELVDSQGWAVRGRGIQAPNSAMNSDAYFEAQNTVDILDGDNSIAQSLSQLIDQSDAKHHQDMIDRMHQPVQVDQPPATPQIVHADPTPVNAYNFFATPQTQQPTNNPFATPQQSQTPPQLQYDPYPIDIQQSVIQPIGAVPVAPQPISPPVIISQPTPQTISKKPIAPDIINLANNADLSIETIAREANRINKERDMGEEVIISLR